MIEQCVTIIDQGRQVIARAQVAEQDGAFIGWIDLSPMPVPLRRLFEEYEEIVNTQTFSLLDEIEEKIENLHLSVLFEDGYEAALADLRIYPSTNKVSFQALKGIVSRPGGTSERTLMEIDLYLHAGHPRVVGHLRELDDPDVGTTIITKIELLRGRFEFMLKAASGTDLLRAC
jgi:hypothetical protein